MDVSELSNQELREHLRELGENPGPITSDVTRMLYERKLLRLLGQECDEQDDQLYPKTYDTDDSDPEDEDERLPWDQHIPRRFRALYAMQEKRVHANTKEEVRGDAGITGLVWSCLAVILALVLVTGAAVFSLLFLGPKEFDAHHLEADGTHR